MKDHPILILYSLGIIVSIGLFNVTGVAITKYASAAQRATVDTCRTLCIWAYAILIGQEHFDRFEFIGFLILVAGTLVYNEIVVIPIEAFRRNTRERLEQMEK
jgi:hypothetical protein